MERTGDFFVQAGEWRQIELRKVMRVQAMPPPSRSTLQTAVCSCWRVRCRRCREKCYQLWSIHKSGPAILSAGLLKTDASGTGFLYAPPSQGLGQLTALAITDEPKGGSVSAKGRKLLYGALN